MASEPVTITLGIPGKNDLVLASVEEWMERTGSFSGISDRTERIECAISLLLGWGLGAYERVWIKENSEP